MMNTDRNLFLFDEVKIHGGGNVAEVDFAAACMGVDFVVGPILTFEIIIDHCDYVKYMLRQCIIAKAGTNKFRFALCKYLNLQ